MPQLEQGGLTRRRDRRRITGDLEDPRTVTFGTPRVTLPDSAWLDGGEPPDERSFDYTEPPIVEIPIEASVPSQPPPDTPDPIEIPGTVEEFSDPAAEVEARRAAARQRDIARALDESPLVELQRRGPWHQVLGGLAEMTSLTDQLAPGLRYRNYDEYVADQERRKALGDSSGQWGIVGKAYGDITDRALRASGESNDAARNEVYTDDLELKRDQFDDEVANRGRLSTGHEVALAQSGWRRATPEEESQPGAPGLLRISPGGQTWVKAAPREEQVVSISPDVLRSMGIQSETSVSMPVSEAVRIGTAYGQIQRANRPPAPKSPSLVPAWDQEGGSVFVEKKAGPLPPGITLNRPQRDQRGEGPSITQRAALNKEAIESIPSIAAEVVKAANAASLFGYGGAEPGRDEKALAIIDTQAARLAQNQRMIAGQDGGATPEDDIVDGILATVAAQDPDVYVRLQGAVQHRRKTEQALADVLRMASVPEGHDLEIDAAAAIQALANAGNLNPRTIEDVVTSIRRKLQDESAGRTDAESALPRIDIP